MKRRNSRAALPLCCAESLRLSANVRFFTPNIPQGSALRDVPKKNEMALSERQSLSAQQGGGAAHRS